VQDPSQTTCIPAVHRWLLEFQPHPQYCAADLEVLLDRDSTAEVLLDRDSTAEVLLKYCWTETVLQKYC
jgi:hypothetical protein